MGVLESLGLGDSGNSGDSSLSPESIAMRRKLAEAMLAQGQADTPIRHWSQGANKVLQSMLGSYELYKTDQADRAGSKEANSQIARIFGGGAASPASPAITPSAPVMTQPATQAQGAAAAAGRNPPPSGQRLPMGMRVNNPGNIKYNPRLGYAGMTGPSQHTDQGDPQMTFDTPQNGMNAAARLALMKYARGQTTAASIVAGEGGWTPGNNEAAANIARTMGVAPDEDLRLSDPARMSTFLQALTMQEHGPASRQYTPEMYETAATAVGRPAAPAADALMPPSGASQLQRQAVELMKNPRNAPLGRELLIKAALAEAPKQPEAVQEYALAVKQGYSKPFMEFKIEMKQAGQREPRTELERRALAGGLQPGTPEYQDYILSGPEKTASDKVPPAYRRTPDGNLEFIPGGPADPANAKPRQFGVSDITKLSEEGTKFGSLTQSLNTFKPEYSGYMSDAAGQVALAAGRKGLSGKTTQDAASWWQGYDRLRNVVRNELFGSALTPNEQKAFEAADITPGMDSKVVQTNLTTQTGIIKNGLKRKANALIEAGYAPEPIASAYGLDLRDIGVTATGRPKTPSNPPPQGAPAAPPQAVQMLQGDPSPQAMQEFDQIFGPGAAQRALGR